MEYKDDELSSILASSTLAKPQQYAARLPTQRTNQPLALGVAHLLIFWYILFQWEPALISGWHGSLLVVMALEAVVSAVIGIGK